MSRGLPLRVALFQPAVPNYRDKLWSRIATVEAGRTRIDLTVYSDIVDRTGGGSVPTRIGSNPAYTPDLRLRSILIGKRRWELVWYRHWPLLHRNVDVVVLPGNARLLNLYLQALVCKIRGIPTVWFGHGFSANSRGLRAHIRMAIMKHGPFDHVILYTDKERGAYVQEGFAADRVSAIDNGVDFEEIEQAKKSWGSVRLAAFAREHGLEGRRWLLFIGRLRDRSGCESLPAVLAAMPADVGLILVGDGPARAALVSALEERGLLDRVRWAGALFSEPEIAPWMMHATVMVYPGTVGLSLIHAFAYALPVVVHDAGHLHGPEYAAVIDGLNALTFSHAVGTPAAISATLSLLGNEALRAAIGRAALEVVSERFNLGSMARNFADALVRVSKLRNPDGADSVAADTSR